MIRSFPSRGDTPAQKFEATLAAAMDALEADIAAAGGFNEDPQNTPTYRLALARSFVYKLFLKAQPWR